MRPEDRFRARCRMYLDAALPAPGWFTAIEHGRKHGGSDQQRMAEWSRMKAQGVKVGIADLMIVYRGRVLWAELKVGKNKPSEAQVGFAEAMEANEFSWRVIRSVTALHEYLEDIGLPVNPVHFALAQGHDRELATEPPPPKAKSRKPQSEKPTGKAMRRHHALRSEILF